VLPAGRRVRRSAEFVTTVRDGRRCGSRGVVVHFVTTAESAPARAGFVVGRRVGPAVVRNRVRRRLRHLVADRLDRLPPAAVLVVRATPEAAELSSAELGRALDRCLGRLLDGAAC